MRSFSQASRSSRWVVSLALSLFVLKATALSQSPSIQHPAWRPVTQAGKKIPKWLTLGTVYRFRAEGRTGLGFGTSSEAYGLGRLLVNVKVQPAPWMRIFFQGQDSRAPNKENATGFFRDAFDMRQAYLELGDVDKYQLSLRFGRQELLYGVQHLVGPLDWGNTSRQFDGVKLTLGAADMNFDVFASSLVNIDPSGFNRSGNGINLYGIYGKFNRLFPAAVFEPFFLWKSESIAPNASPGSGDANVYTLGFRFVRPLAAGFDLATEVAPQLGTFAGKDISALGAYGILGYSPPGWRMNPRFSFELAYASGRRGPGDDKVRTFDQLFPTAHLYLGITDRVGWRNIKSTRLGVELKPHSRAGLNLDFFSFRLASRRDHLYGANGRILVSTPSGGARSGHVGEEFDAVLVFRPAEHATVGAGYGYLFAGDFLKETSPGKGTSFPYLFVNYAF